VDVSGKVTSDLHAAVQRASYWWNKDLSNLAFDVRVNFPIFTTNPGAVSISLSWAEEIQISTHVWFEDVVFSIDAEPLSVGLDTKIKTTWQSNPVLYFEASGAYKADNSVLLWGAMEGTWVEPFGIKGFDLSDVIVELGFNPMLCSIDACVSDFGLGMQLNIGDKIIKFDGNVAAPDFWNVFLEGSLSGGKGQPLPVLSVAQEWNKINPSHPVPTSLIPSSWSLTDCSFYFAPEDGQFGPIFYTKGFGVTGGITIYDMHFFLSLNCTDGSGISCNFDFDVHIDINEFANAIAKEVGLIYPDVDVNSIFSLKDVKLSEWSQKDVALGTNPRWLININILNKDNILDFRVKQDELTQSFHDFFMAWLNHLFH